jgi:hypothetical protein
VYGDDKSVHDVMRITWFSLLQYIS